MTTAVTPTALDTGTARARIFAALRGPVSGLPATPLPAPDLSPFLDGPFAAGARGTRPDPDTLVAPFEAAARGWRADIVHARTDDWPHAVRAVLDRHGARRIVAGTRGEVPAGLGAALAGLVVRRFDEALERWKPELFDAIDAGVTGADAGIAATGTLLLRPGPGEPRTLSLVPPLHVVVLRASRLYASLPAAAAALGLTAPGADLPTNLVLVTGPSKTSDIQQTLAYGAHGPKALVIVLVNDLPGDDGVQR